MSEITMTNREYLAITTRRTENRIRRALRKGGLYLRKSRNHSEDGPRYLIADADGVTVYGAGDGLDLGDALRFAQDVFADWRKDRR